MGARGAARRPTARALWLLAFARPAGSFGPLLVDPKLPARRLAANSSAYADCVDANRECGRWARAGECNTNPTYMREQCRAACSVCQSATCHDDADGCARWAESGECHANADYMLKACPFSCRVCGINFKSQCRRDGDMRPMAVPGTIDATFERAAREYAKPYGARVVYREPWVMAFDHFLTDAEVDVLVARAGHRFERSLAGDGVTSVRTSATSWCNVDDCLQDPVVQAVRARIVNVTGVPWTNAEHLQVLRYEKGEFYKEHHDQNSPRHSAWGPRLYTFFMYLSDVDEGGETRFTRLNLSITPRKGSAILWPSVMSSDPFQTDDRTYHEAVTVRKGLKYSANFWIHMYEFQDALMRGCGNVDYFQDDLLHRDLRAPA